MSALAPGEHDRHSGGPEHLTIRDFRRLAKFIHDYSGIKLPESKKTMVEGRLRKRVAATGFAHLTAYCRHLFEEGGLAAETISLIDVMTTNKTEFFREPEHFRFLAEVALPEFAAARRAAPQTPIKVWCAASSIGAEPYTLAMVLADASQRLGGFRFNVVATDISTRVLETAALAIYPEAMIAPVPIDMRQRYLLRSRQASRGLVRVGPELRRLVSFARLNLMDASYPMDRDMDAIFCRNILIYFDKPTQNAVLTRLCNHLRPGGYLVLGHSESLAGFDLPVKAIGSTVFRRE
jgi:chemotaxis protein methyltransferase CheR